MHLAGGQRAVHGLAVRLRDHEHDAARGVLRHDGDGAASLLEIESREIKHAIAPLTPTSVPRRWIRRSNAE